MRFIALLILTLLLTGCRFTKNRLTVDRAQLEDCCCNYFYYPKNDYDHWSEESVNRYYTRKYKISYGFLSKKIATQSIVGKDTTYIYSYDKLGKIIAKETITSKGRIAFDCYVKSDTLYTPTNR